MNGYIVNGIVWNLDPSGSYGHATDRQIVEACGLIPHFLDGQDARAPRAQFEERYVFGCHWHTEGQVVDHQFLYPEDPPMAAYAWTTFQEAQIWIFPHGVVAIRSAEGEFAQCRMD